MSPRCWVCLGRLGPRTAVLDDHKICNGCAKRTRRINGRARDRVLARMREFMAEAHRQVERCETCEQQPST